MRLDAAYDNRAHVPGSERFPPAWEKAAAAFRKAVGARCEKAVPYGPSERQVYDFFQPEGVPRGTVMFVHGGYWKAFDNRSWSHLAAGPLARGWAVAIPSYDLCPDVRLSEIAAQIARALSHVAARTQGPMALAGHSAGGHLVARIMDPILLASDVRDRVAQIVPISPLSNLGPLRETSMNEILQIDEAEALSESPVNMPPPHGVDVTVWVGAEELPALVEQAQELGRAWGAKVVLAEGLHHFDVIDALADPDSDMVRALLGIR